MQSHINEIVFFALLYGETCIFQVLLQTTKVP